MDTQDETTTPEQNPEEIRRRNRSEYGKKWRQANKERKKEYQKNWEKQRKLLKANAIRITEDEFITMLEARKSILDTATKMIDIGFKAESKFCESLFAATEKIEKVLAKRIGIKSWDCMPNDFNSLTWGLAYLDKGEPAVIAFTDPEEAPAPRTRIVKICNYKKLFRTIMEEVEQQRADDRDKTHIKEKQSKATLKSEGQAAPSDTAGELFHFFEDADEQTK